MGMDTRQKALSKKILGISNILVLQLQARVALSPHSTSSDLAAGI